MKKITALLLVLAMAVALCACGSSTDSSTPAADTAASDAAPAAETLVMGTSADYAPFEFMYPDADGNMVYGGIDVSVAQYVADYTGKELKVENMGFDYLLASLQKGDFDIVIAAMEATEERQNAADFSDPYYTDYPAMILIKADKADEYTSLDSFSGKAVAAQTATTKEDIVKNDMPGANLVSLQVVTSSPTIRSTLLSSTAPSQCSMPTPTPTSSSLISISAKLTPTASQLQRATPRVCSPASTRRSLIC